MFTLCALGMPAPQASASTENFTWYFYKNYSDQTNSKFDLYYTTAYYYGLYKHFRGGSGLQGVHDDCATNRGWLPNGRYDIPGYSYNWPGSVVRGPVLRLPDKRCAAGTTIRTELFVHSTYPWSTSRYQSYGCIKLSNTSGPSPATGDIKTAVDLHVTNSQPLKLYVS